MSGNKASEEGARERKREAKMDVMDGDVDSEQGRGKKCGESQPVQWALARTRGREWRGSMMTTDNRTTGQQEHGRELSITVLTDNN